jgi:predicted secreted Zn-dependent protease
MLLFLAKATTKTLEALALLAMTHTSSHACLLCPACLRSKSSALCFKSNQGKGFMKKRLLLSKASILFCLLSSNAFATPTVNINTEYYSIYGSTATELRNEMSTKSSIKQSGNTYDAYTSWVVNWRFSWNVNNGQCAITSVKSSVDVNFTLPKWENSNSAAVNLKQRWKHYYNALIAHENGHKDFGINAAKEVEKRLSVLSAKNCSSLKSKANSLGKKIIDKYVIAEKKYDKNTNHGMKDGAVFP